MPLKPKNFDSSKVIHPPSGQDRTQQHLRDETNINHIIAKFKRTGVLQGARTTPPKFGDFTSADFMEMHNLVLQAKDDFMSLSARLRSRFANDPARLMAWLENPQNHDEAVRLGLIKTDDQVVDPYITQEEANQAELDRLNNEALEARQAAQRADDEAQPPHGQQPRKGASKAE